MASSLRVTKGMWMPLVKRKKSEDPERFGLKFQMDVWLLVSMFIET